ncbi:MAG TPA: toll/interleukin-1 receptor domain-containing protein [Thermoanaerobaculia bacterium]|nr:toll/interleukin-1 receptor domain-containing protein [Thermoanaerobaculia bacterium]
MSQVFLSYRHVPPDEQLAEGLCAFLQERGLRVFLDKQMEIGLVWAAEIDRQLRASDSFVVLLSEDSIRSAMVRQEIETAHELRQAGKMKIFPVRLGFEGKLPYDLGSYLNDLHYALWNPGDSKEGLFARLYTAITGGAALPVRSSSEDTAVLSLKDLSVAAETKGAPHGEYDYCQGATAERQELPSGPGPRAVEAGGAALGLFGLPDLR